ncbi:MAG: TIGR04283 family arsenosugar biosynthesis glycosyltransferase [Deferribacterales bacterium]
MTVSVIIPVFNEQENINRIISSLNDCEIIISDCNGETLKAVSDKSVITVMSEKGRGNQQNAGAEKASGDILLFLHADTKLPENWLEKISETLKKYDCGAFSLGIDSSQGIFRVLERVSTFRSRITKIPYGDQAIFIRRELFEKIGGFRDYPIFEDFRLMQDVKRSGAKIHILKERVMTSPRRWQKEGVIYTTARNWLITILYLCGVSPHKLKKLY